jgi:hypothetical protein
VDTLEKVITVGRFSGVTLGIIVLFIGKRLNDAFGFLREFNIPEPVTGLFGLQPAIGVLGHSSVDMGQNTSSGCNSHSLHRFPNDGEELRCCSDLRRFWGHLTRVYSNGNG